MIYNDFKRVNDIDTQIMSLHKEILALYEEKSVLLNAPTLVSKTFSATTPLTAAVTYCPKQMYETLKQNWARFDVRLPAYSLLKSKILKTQALIEKIKEDDSFEGDVHGMLVPPTDVLIKAMAHADAPQVDIESFNVLDLDTNKNWQCAVMFERPCRQAVEDVRNFTPEVVSLETVPVDSNTSVNTLTAAYLQGLEVADDDTWTMLLGDMDAAYQTPCARMVNNSLKFTIDDSAGLLGDNYYHPSITVKS